MWRHHPTTPPLNIYECFRIWSFLQASPFELRHSSSCAKKENPGEDGVSYEHCQECLNNGCGGGLSDTFRPAFDVQSRVARDRDDDPGEGPALDHSRIQIPGLSAFECTHNVTGGVEIKRESANRPAAKHTDVVSENRQRWKHDKHGKETRHDQILDRIDRHHFQRFDYFGHFHRS